MYYFIVYLLSDCWVVYMINKNKIFHPKLYTSIYLDDEDRVNAIYLSNIFDSSGQLKEKSIILDDFDSSSSYEEILLSLNQIEFKKLKIFISRQKKTIDLYRMKGRVEQFRIVSDSLDLLLKLDYRFKIWFRDMESIL